MVDCWIAESELTRLSGWTARHVQRKVKDGALVSRRAARHGRNGKSAREYSVASLPPELQVKLARESAFQQNPQSATTVATCAALVPGAVTLPRKDGRPPRIALTEEQRKQAMTRLEAIQPLLDFRERKREGRAPVVLPGGRTARSLDALGKCIAPQYGVSWPTLRRWLSEYSSRGLEGLADGVRSDKGVSRFFLAHPVIDKFVQAKYLSERLGVRTVFDGLRREFPDVALPCYDTLRVYLRSIPEPIKIMAREGSRKFKERVEPYLLREPPKRVNQVWISDHVQHDVWVRNRDGTGQPFFQGLALDLALRPWMTAWQDWRSRKIVGAAWCTTPSSHTISSALRIGILECGIPEEAYVDNGRDYRKVRKGAAHELNGQEDPRMLSPECIGVLARLGIKTTDCLPYHPQSKPIESWFGNRLHERFDALWSESYCGTSSATRPEQCDEALRQHRLFLEGKRNSSPLPTTDDFAQAARQFIVEYNSEMPHSGRGMNNRTPDEVFAELGENIRKLDDDSRAALGALFWDRQQRKVAEGGCVQLYNRRFEPADDATRVALYERLGREVLVASDPADLRQALALDLDGTLLGEFKCSELAEHGPRSHEAVQASLRERRRAARGVRRYIETLGQGVESERVALCRRAGIPLTVQSEVPMPAMKQLAAAIAVGQTHPPFIEDVAEALKESLATQQEKD